MNSEIVNNILVCKVCKKQFPKYDQRGYRNAGFTAHQNRCIEKESALALPPPIQIPVKRRRLLPAPPKDEKSHKKKHDDIKLTAQVNIFTSAINTSTVQCVEQLSQQSTSSSSTNDFQPVLRCDYCEPENGVHQTNCSIIRFVKGNSDGST